MNVERFATHLMSCSCSLKYAHWNTTSFKDHVLIGDITDKIDDALDKIVELEPNWSGSTPTEIRLVNRSTEDHIISLLRYCESLIGTRAQQVVLDELMLDLQLCLKHLRMDP